MEELTKEGAQDRIEQWVLKKQQRPSQPTRKMAIGWQLNSWNQRIQFCARLVLSPGPVKFEFDQDLPL